MEPDTLTKLAMELQSIAQNGLTYAKDPYDKERFERAREISAELMRLKTGLPLETVKTLFCNETGYQTPKIETRAAIFRENKILLVKEREQWALPGGWIDYNETVASNTVKEVKEEAGLDVVAQRIIAVQDRNRHNVPPYAYGICKVFVLCTLLGGEFRQILRRPKADIFRSARCPFWTRAGMCTIKSGCALMRRPTSIGTSYLINRYYDKGEPYGHQKAEARGYPGRQHRRCNILCVSRAAGRKRNSR